MGLFSGISSALSSIGSSISGAFAAPLGGIIGVVQQAGTSLGQQASQGFQRVVAAAAPLLPLAQLLPGPIGLAANALVQGQSFLGSQGRPVGFAGAGPAAARPTFGPATQAAFSGPVANLPPRTTFGFGGFGQPSFGRPFNAATFPGGNAGSTARQGFASFPPAVALGSPPFGFGRPAAPTGFGFAFGGFSFTGFRRSLAGFSFLS